MKKILILLVLSAFSICSFSQNSSKGVKKEKVKKEKVKKEKVKKEKVKKEKVKKEKVKNISNNNLTSKTKFLDDFTLSADINFIEAMHLNGGIDVNDNDIDNLSSFVLKLKKDLILNKNLNLYTSLGYSFGFEYLPLEFGLSYEVIDNLSANIGCGLFLITDDRWVTYGEDGDEASNNEFGLVFGVDYSLNDKIGIQINYNAIEAAEDVELASLSLNSLSFGVSYKL
jgi:hypothetical protein